MSFYYNIRTPIGSIYDFDVNKNTESVEEAVEDWFVDNVMPKGNTLDSIRGSIEDMDISSLQKLYSDGGKKFKKYFGKFLRSLGKSDDLKEIIDFIKQVKGGAFPTKDSLKKYTFYKENPDFSSNTLDRFYDESKPTPKSFYDFGGIKKLSSFPLSKLNSILNELDVEIQNSYALEKASDLHYDLGIDPEFEESPEEIQNLRRLYGKDAINVENLIADILRSNKKIPKSYANPKTGEIIDNYSESKVDVPIKIGLSNFVDVDNTREQGPKYWYTTLRGIPRGEVIQGDTNLMDTPEGREELSKVIEKDYIKDATYYPKASEMFKATRNFLEIPKYQKDAETSIEVVNPENREDYLSSSSNSFMANTRGFDSADEDVVFDSIISNIEDKVPDSRYPDNPAVYFKDIIEKYARRKQKQDTKVSIWGDFVKKVDSWIENSVEDKVDLDNIVKYASAIEKRIKKAYYTFDEEERDAIERSEKGQETIDDLVARFNINMSRKALSNTISKWFEFDFDSQDIGKVKETGANKLANKGLRYEHVVPMKIMGQVLVALYEGMVNKYGDNIDPKKFVEEARKVIKELYTIAWIDRDEDLKLTSSGLQDEIPQKDFEKIVDIVSKKGIDNVSKEDIFDSIVGRYEKAGLVTNRKTGESKELVSIRDLTGASGFSDSVDLKIPIENLLKQQLDEIDIDKNLYPDRRISRTNAKLPMNLFRPKIVSTQYLKDIGKTEEGITDYIKKRYTKKEEGERYNLPREFIDSVFKDVLEEKFKSEDSFDNIFVTPKVGRVISKNIRENKKPTLTNMLFGYYG